MSQSMSSEITISSKNLITLCTGERFLFSMRQQMCFQIGPLIKCFPASWAAMRWFIQMQYLVYGQRPWLAKSFAAFFAFERLVFGMNVSMVSQMILPAKRFSANITIVGTFISVCAFMNQQIVWLGKLPVAILTYVSTSLSATISCFILFVLLIIRSFWLFFFAIFIQWFQ